MLRALFLTSVLILPSPLWAQATPERAAQIAETLARYLPGDRAGLTVEPAGADYVVTVDFAALATRQAQRGLKLEATPLTLHLTEEAGGTFGDIGRFGVHGFEALKTVGLRGISFQETEFSPNEKDAGEEFAKLKEKFLALAESETALVKAGISPHSPYTVGSRLFEKIAEYATETGVKITIHAAESAEEEELLQKGTGFFAKMYEKFGFEWRAPGCSSIELTPCWSPRAPWASRCGRASR